MKTTLQTKQKKGFTLIELLIVMAIIAVLAGLGVVGFGTVQDRQLRARAELQMELLQVALEEYKADVGDYPNLVDGSLFDALYGFGAQNKNKEGEEASVDSPALRIYMPQLDPNAKKSMVSDDGSRNIIDPWGNNWIYRRGEDSGAQNPDFDLFSVGKDGQTGDPATERDDIQNW